MRYQTTTDEKAQEKRRTERDREWQAIIDANDLINELYQLAYPKPEPGSK